MPDDMPDRCSQGLCDHNKCDGCGQPHSVPAGYLRCRSCTFGADSVEGRIDRAWSINSGNSPAQSIAEEERIVAARRAEIEDPD